MVPPDRFGKLVRAHDVAPQDTECRQHRSRARSKGHAIVDLQGTQESDLHGAHCQGIGSERSMTRKPDGNQD